MTSSHTRLNLRNVTSLLVDSDHFTRGLVQQMLRGFGMDTPHFYDNGTDARDYLEHTQCDVVIMEAALPDMPSADLIRWIRRTNKGQLRFVPIIVMSGYTQLRLVSQARDAGANIVIRKPVSPQALFDRLLWVARMPRPFIETGDYAGPDRRFHDNPPMDGKYKRETDENAEHTGEQSAA